MFINVAEEMAKVRPKEPEINFINEQPVDKMAAAQRFISTEKMFEEWHAVINRTNTRELPKELIDEYNNAALSLCKILTYEKRLMLSK